MILKITTVAMIRAHEIAIGDKGRVVLAVLVSSTLPRKGSGDCISAVDFATGEL